ncbi:hypothetical protein P5V15_009221 [Pogonomyrmex californicus]
MESAVALKTLCVTSLIKKWMTSLSLRTSESGTLATLRHFPSTDSQRTASTVFFGRVKIPSARRWNSAQISDLPEDHLGHLGQHLLEHGHR